MSEAMIEAVVIGASAGAIDALLEILPELPEHFSLPVIVVVHLREDRNSALVDLFRQRCSVEVCEAEDKMPLAAGTVYFAPPDYHLLVDIERWLALSVDPPVQYSRPSIDVLFQSAADAFGEGLVGIVLSGANSDGAQGLRSIVDAHGIALVQEPAGAHAPRMPQAAINACPEARRLSLEQIATYLRELGTRQ
jgi:two-component system, chemotaxis family, protein-glutamate methylesterase/glutaminase